eukprot:gb/GECG01016504.1/.p1 GENE.gb/GECG01016504.1/~~gb/GECG01016504.1/.p1  ORF type:complete len:1423 (+),score=155.66 gb/GECG01016504.1/:1-4269(+)
MAEQPQLQHGGGGGENRSSQGGSLTVKKSGALQKRFVQIISYAMLRWRYSREVDVNAEGENKPHHPVVEFLTKPLPSIRDDIFDDVQNSSNSTPVTERNDEEPSIAHLDKETIDARLKTHLEHLATILESSEIPAEFEYYPDPSSSASEPIAQPSPVFRNHVSRALTLATRDYLVHKEKHYSPLGERDDSGIQKFRAVIVRTIWEVTQLVVESLRQGIVGLHDPVYHPGLTVLCHCMLSLKSKWDRQDDHMTTIGHSDNLREYLNPSGDGTSSLPEYVEVDVDGFLDGLLEEFQQRMRSCSQTTVETEPFFISLSFIVLIADAFGFTITVSPPRLQLIVSLLEFGANNSARYLVRKLFVEKGACLDSISNMLIDQDKRRCCLDRFFRIAKERNLIGKTLDECISQIEEKRLCHDALTGLVSPSSNSITHVEEKPISFPFEEYSSCPSIPALEAARVAMLSFFVSESTARSNEDSRRKPSTVSTVRASYLEDESDGLKKSYERLESLGKIVETYREKLCQLVLRNLSTSEPIVDVIFPQATNETCRKRILIGDSKIAEALRLGNATMWEALTPVEVRKEAQNFCSDLLQYVRSPEKVLTNSINQLVDKGRLDLSVTFAGTDLRLQVFLVDVLTSKGKIEEAKYLSREFELSRRVGTVVAIFEGLNSVALSGSDITYSPQWFSALKQRKDSQMPKPFTSRFGCDLSELLRTYPSAEQDQCLNVPMIFYDSMVGFLQNSNYLNLREPIRAVGQPEMTVPVVTVSTLEDVNVLAELLHVRVHATGSFSLPIVGLDVEWRPNSIYDYVTPSYDSLADADHTDFFLGKWALRANDARTFIGRYYNDLQDQENGSVEWPASILQLATNEITLLVDLLALQQDPSTELDTAMDHTFGDLLLRSSSVYITGHGVSGDLQKIVRTHPRWQNVFSMASTVIDLRNLPLYGDPQMTNPPRSIGLAKLVDQILGWKLRKKEQTSDWQQRPLSGEQKRYGAIDAFVGVALVCSSLDMQSWSGRSGLASETLRSISEDVRLSLGGFSTDEGGMFCSFWHRYVPSLDLDFIRDMQSVLNIRCLLCTVQPDDISLDVRLAEHVCGESAYQTSKFIGVSVERIVKTLAFTVAGKNVITLMPGHLNVDPMKLSRLMGVSSRKVRLASRVHCEATYGYIPGEFPPVGFPQDVRIFIDTSLESADYVYGGGGTTRHMLVTYFDELIRVNRHNSKGMDRVCISDLSKSGKTSSQIGHSVALNSTNRLETIDDLGLEHSWNPPKFLADSMLGRLVRWLRVIGVDCLDTERTTPREDMVKKSLETDRILLTRDAKLVSRKDLYLAFLVRDNETADQFKQVTEHFGIVCSPSGLMSRCAKCNGEGYYRLDRDTVREKYSHIVHEKVLRTVEEYWQCRSCGKLYWEGPKFYDTREKFEAILHEYEKVF